MTRRPKRDPYSRTVVYLPEQKLSESLLDFAAPLLDRLGLAPSPDEARRALDLAIGIWNAHVMAGPVWGELRPLRDARKSMAGKQAPRGLAHTFALLSVRWRTKFALDPRFVGTWSFEPTDAGRCELLCEWTLPEGVEAYVPPPAEKRFAIGGKYLDEVCIRQSVGSFLSFPVERHLGWVADDGMVVTLHTMMPTVVELFAEGVLKPIGAAPVEIAVGGKQLGPMVLSELRCEGERGRDDGVALVFRRGGT